MTNRLSRIKGYKLRSIVSSHYFKDISRLTFGALAAQIITLIVSPISTRLYSPEQLGIYTLIITVSAMFGPVLAGKYDMAIVSAENEKEANELVIGSFIFSLITILIISIGYHFYLISKPAILNEVGIFAYSLIGILLVQAITNVLNYNNNRQKEYGIISRVYVIRTAFQNLGLVFLGLLNFGAIGLLLSQLFGSIAGLKKQSQSLMKKRSEFKEIHIIDIRKVMKKYIRQPIFAMPAHFINSLSYSILNFFITGLFGIGVFGYYSMTYRILGLPLSLVSMNVSKIFFQRASEENRNKGVYNKTLVEITLFLLVLAIPMVIVLVLFAPRLFEIVFGDGWRVAGKYAQILAPMYGLRFIVSPLAAALIISSKQKLELLMQSLFVISSVMGYLFTKNMAFEIETFLVIISVTYSLIYLFFYISIYRLSKNTKK